MTFCVEPDFSMVTEENWPAYVWRKTGIKYNIEEKEKYKNIDTGETGCNSRKGEGKLERDRSEKRNPNNVTRICSRHHRPEYHRPRVA